MKLKVLIAMVFLTLRGLAGASVVMIDYQATGSFSPNDPDLQTGSFNFAFSAPQTALYGVESYSTPSTLSFSNGLRIPSILTFTPTVLKQVGENISTDVNEFDFYPESFPTAGIPFYRFFFAGDNITDGRRSDGPRDLTDTNFIAGTHAGDADSMITYWSWAFGNRTPGTSFTTVPVDRFTITGTIAPVPETSSMALGVLLTGALGWLVIRRRPVPAGSNV